jgi:hypothetical protein
LKVYIHIGSDKCGSTAIQTSLNRNREELIKQGVYLPTSGLGRSNGHSRCFKDKTGALFQSLINELQSVENNFASAVISFEGIHFISEKDLAQRYYQLQEFDATAIYYVRDQAELIQSGILQQWKTSSSSPPFEISLNKNRLFFDVAERWNTFLNNQTNVAVFDRSAFPNGDITLDFYTRLGVGDLSNITAVRSDFNDRLAFESAYLLSALDRMLPMEKSRRQGLVGALIIAQDEFDLTKYFLSQSDVESTRTHYQKNNKLLEKNMSFPR